MTRSEMLDAVKRVFKMEDAEAEVDRIVVFFDEAVPNANVIDMPFWPDAERTPEQIVDEVLRCQQVYTTGNASEK